MADCDAFTTTTELYLGHDNAVTIIPYSDLIAQENYNMAAVTAVTAAADLLTSVTTGDAIPASSVDNPVTISFDQDPDGVWQIHLKVGLFVGIVAGEYTVRVIIVDPTSPNGLVIADDLLVTIVDVP